MTDFLVKTCKQQTGRQVRVAKTCGPFPFFLHHYHLRDLWSECQRWKYTNRYSLIIYSQVYIPKTVTFHYFQLCLKTIPSEVDPFSSLISEYKASQRARYSKQQQWSCHKSKQSWKDGAWALTEVCYLHCAPLYSLHRNASLTQWEHSWARQLEFWCREGCI